LPVPDDIVKRINKILFSFLWGKKDKVKRIKVIKKLKEGGLNMVDIQCLFDSFKAAWMGKILKANKEVDCWAQLPNLYLSKFESFDIVKAFNFASTVNFKEIKGIYLFLQEVISCFAKTN